MSSEDILTQTPPAPDRRVAYGADPSQFMDVRLPAGAARGPLAAALFIHGGYWRSKYDLVHAGHLCAALSRQGVASFNIEYRRVGNPGGGWPGSFEDIRSAYSFLRQNSSRFNVDPNRLLVLGHSAGGQLALCLSAHEPTVRRVISLAGVLDLQKGFRMHLSHDAVAEFLGGTPDAVPDHYREADPMELRIANARQWMIHGGADDTVPIEFSREYVTKKQKSGESVALLEVAHAGHFDLIDPLSEGFKTVQDAVKAALGS